MTDYKLSNAITSIEYFVRDLPVTDGTYDFVESPICNYSELVTMTNLPPWATHNLANSDFTVAQTSDLARIGEYVVTIRSEISMPSDYSKSLYNVLFDEHDFSILI